MYALNYFSVFAFLVDNIYRHQAFFYQSHLIRVVSLDKTLTGEGGGRRNREGRIVNTRASGDGAFCENMNICVWFNISQISNQRVM